MSDIHQHFYDIKAGTVFIGEEGVSYWEHATTPALGRQSEALPVLREAIALMERAGLQYDGSGTHIDRYRQLAAQWEQEDIG